MYDLSRSAPARGAIANVTNVVRNAVDVKVLTDERRPLRTAKSCGPGAPRSGAKLATMLSHRADDGGKRDGSPRRARISRNPSRREGRCDHRLYLWFTRSRNFCCAGAPGAAATRPSLRPRHSRRVMAMQSSDANCAARTYNYVLAIIASKRVHAKRGPTGQHNSRKHIGEPL
jgi:hypothetical protein